MLYLSHFYVVTSKIFFKLRGSVFFFKQKTAYELRISDWSSDVCSSDLRHIAQAGQLRGTPAPFTGDDFVAVLALRAYHDWLDQALCADRIGEFGEIGRASCRERVCQYV